MKNIYLIMLFFSSLTLFGCKEDKEEEIIDNTPKIAFEFTVWNATKRTSSNPNAEVSPNASIYIFLTKEDADNNKPKYTGKTNSNGIFTISVPAQESFYVTAINSNAKITKNGFLINGVFKSQQEINNNPRQTPAAQVGDLIFADFNGDGVVDNLDKISCLEYSGLRTSTTVLKSNIYIAE
jgi:hypothetical protein